MNILDHSKAHQRFFEEMTQIPHGSFHEQAYSEYLIRFAQTRNLKYKSDELYNVIIYKEASQGYEEHNPVILQAHTDMVCEKNQGTNHDFGTQPLDIYIENGFVKAKGTTLGADDGTGVSYMLALLDGDYSHPALECAFTTQEEVGLLGAKALKKQDFKGQRLINLDGGEEGTTDIASAGGEIVVFKHEIEMSDCDMPAYQIGVKGLSGGHSGVEIQNEKGNSNKILVRLLDKLQQKDDILLSTFQGGMKDNAIPRESTAIIHTNIREELIQQIIDEFHTEVVAEYQVSEATIYFEFSKVEHTFAYSKRATNDCIACLMLLPDGVRHHSMEIADLTTASSNIAVVLINDDQCMITASIRGALESYVDTIAKEMRIISGLCTFEMEEEARYPAWDYEKDSNMRSILQQTYENLYQKPLTLKATHGGLECGVFKAMDTNMDIVTLGPDMYDIHTPDERLELTSFDRVFELLIAFLKKL